MKRILPSTLLLFALVSSVAHGQFEMMRQRIPADTNTVVLINAAKMFGAEIADRERWSAQRQAAYDAGILALPPDATEVMLAGRMDLEYGSNLWEMALVKLQAERNVLTVAERFGGSIDEIVGRSSARLPGDHYVIQMTPNILGSYMPANRQDVARWLASTDVGPTVRPAYIEKAFDYAAKVGTPIIMAMDLEGVISEAVVKQRLESFDAFTSAGLDIDQVAKLLAGTQGITLGVTLGADAVGAIRVDFSESPASLSKIGKEMLVEVLQRHGAMIDDFRDWTPEVSGNTFLLRGKLSNAGARRLMSVLALPQSLAHARDDAMSPGAQTDESKMRLASQQYFKSVTNVLDDLREKPKRDHVKTFGQAAMWYDKYAKKIDQLPILNVDPALLSYGTDVASLLREGEMAMKGVGMRSSVRTGQNNPSSGGYSYSYGGYRAGMGYEGGLYGMAPVNVSLGPGRASVNEKGRTDAIIRGEERTAGAASVQQIWQSIEGSTAAIRRDMVNKYSADF